MKNLFLLTVILISTMVCLGQNDGKITVLVHKSNVSFLSEIFDQPEHQLLEKEETNGMLYLIINRENFDRLRNSKIDYTVLDGNRATVTLNPIQSNWGTGYILYEDGAYNRYATSGGNHIIRVGLKNVSTWAPYRGFVKYNISSLPSNAIINSITLQALVHQASTSSGHRVGVKRLNVDPAGSNIQQIFNAINDNADAAWFYSNWNALASGQSGWKSVTLWGNRANVDLQNKLNSGSSWWALGFIEVNENDATGSFRGRDQNSPRVVINYSVPVNLAISPISWNFGNVNVGNNSGNKSFTLTNNGSATTSGSVVLDNGTHFTIVSGGGSFTLSPGASRTITARFNPQSAGNKSDYIDILVGGNLVEYSVLSGNGIDPPSFSLTPTSHNFGNVNVGSNSNNQSFTLTNTGSSTTSGSITLDDGAHYTILSGGGSFTLSPNSTRTIVVRFNPQSAGSKTDYLDILVGGNLIEYSTLSGTGVASGNINVTVKNIGGTSIPLPGSNGFVRLLSSNGSHLATSNTNSSGVATFSNRAFDSYIIEALHNPNNPTTIFGEEFWGFKSINHNSAPTNEELQRHMPHRTDYIRVLNSSGQEITGQSVPLGTPLTFKVKIKNPDPVNPYTVRSRLVVDRNKSTDYDFDQMSSPNIIPHGNVSMEYTFNYTPTQVGDYYAISGTRTSIGGNYQYTDGDAWHTEPSITISGPDLNISPLSYEFGDVQIGDTPLTKIFTLTNNGNSNATGCSASLSNSTHFSITQPTGSFTVPANGSISIHVRFNPQSTGYKNTNLQISYSGGSLPAVPIEGYGYEPDVIFSATQWNAGEIEIGETVGPLPVQLTNIGTNSAKGTVQLDYGTHFSIVSGGGSFNLNPNQSKQIQVVFQPQATGNHYDYLDAISLSGTYLEEVSLQGVGIPQPPVASITQLTGIPSSIDPYEPFAITVKLKNTGAGNANNGGISISFPTLTEENPFTSSYNTSQGSVFVNSNFTTFPDRTFYDAGSTIFDSNNNQMPAQHLLFEAVKSDWAPNEEHELVISVTPKLPGPFPIKIRGWLDQTSRDPDGSGSGISVDQQGYFAFEEIVDVAELLPDITMQLYRISDTNGNSNTANPGNEKEVFTPGETVRVTFRAKNEGAEVPVQTLLNIFLPNNEDKVYDSDPDDNNINPLPADGNWHYYSFNWAIPSNFSYTGSLNLGGAIRDLNHWHTVYETTCPGSNTDFECDWILENMFSIQTSAHPALDIPIVMYHNVYDIAHTQYWVDVLEFEKHMAFLDAYGYNPVSLSQVVDYMDNGVALPSNPVVLTFDDGFENFYTHAYPILLQHGFKATSFIITDFIGNSEGTRMINNWEPDPVESSLNVPHLIWPEIQEMAQNQIDFQSHSKTHPNLSDPDLPQSQLEDEIFQSKAAIENKLGSCDFFSYPFGGFNDNVVNTVIDAGYLAAVDIDRGEGMFNTQTSNRYLMERLDIKSTTTTNDFALKVEPNFSFPDIEILSVAFYDENNNQTTEFSPGETITTKVNFVNNGPSTTTTISLNLHSNDSPDEPLAYDSHLQEPSEDHTVTATTGQQMEVEYQWAMPLTAEPGQWYYYVGFHCEHYLLWYGGSYWQEGFEADELDYISLEDLFGQPSQFDAFQHEPVFEYEYTMIQFVQSDGGYIWLPFEGGYNNTPVADELVDDPVLAEALYNTWLFRQYFLQFSVDYLLPYKNFYDLDRWWDTQSGLEFIFNMASQSKRKSDRLLIGNMAFFAAEELFKAKVTGGKSLFGLIAGGLTELFSHQQLEGLNEQDIQHLILAHGYYGGDLSIFEDMEDTFFADLSLDLIKAIKDIKSIKSNAETMEHLLNAIDYAASGNTFGFNYEIGELLSDIDGVLSGMIYDEISNVLLSATGLPELKEQSKVYAWLHDAYFEAIYVVCDDLIEIRQEIDDLLNTPYTDDMASQIRELTDEFSHKYAMLFRGMRLGLTRMQANHLQHIRNTNNNFTASYVGASQSNLDALADDYEIIHGQYNDDINRMLNFSSKTMGYYAGYHGALESLKNKMANSIRVAYANDGQPVIYPGQLNHVEIEIFNDYQQTVEINELSFEESSGYIFITNNTENIMIAPLSSAIIEISLDVDEYWFTYNIESEPRLTLGLSWQIAGQEASNNYLLNLNISSLIYISDLSTDKNIYLPNDDLTLMVTYQGQGTEYVEFLGSSLLKPDGARYDVGFSFFPENNVFEIDFILPSGPYGAWGAELFLAEGNKLLTPYSIVNRMLYLVPELSAADLIAFDWDNFAIIYPKDDYDAAYDIKTLTGLNDDDFYKLEDYSLNDLLSVANSKNTILLGGHLANPLVEQLTTTSLASEGDAIIEFFPDAFGSQNAFVVAGWLLRDTQIAAMGFVHQFNTIDMSLPESPSLVDVSQYNDEIRIEWTSADDHIINYNIYRGTAPNTTQLLTSIPVGSNTYYDDHDLVYGMTYYYRVTAVNQHSIESEYSNELSILFQESPEPTLSVYPNQLSFSDTHITNCEIKSYTLFGEQLLSAVTISAPLGFQVSTSQTTGFEDAINVPHINGSVDQTIYVQFCPQEFDNYSGEIANESAGATTAMVNVSGTGIGLISDINVSQRLDGSGLIDVYYTLDAPDDEFDISLLISFDGGISFEAISVDHMEGDITGVSPGSDKHIVWDGLAGFEGIYSTEAILDITASMPGFNLNAQSPQFIFDMRLWELTTEASPPEGGTVTGAGSYLEWKSVQLEANPASAYEFENWTENGNVVSTLESFEYMMPGENKTLTANFEQDPCLPPDWTPAIGPQYTMNVIGQIHLNDEVSLNLNNIVGAFVDGECRGVASPLEGGEGILTLSIGSNVSSGETVEFLIWDSESCEICNTHQTLEFNDGMLVGEFGDPYIFECGMDVQELPLTFGQGYTWFSVNVEPETGMGLNELLLDLSPCADDRVISQTTFAFYSGTNWMGSLTHINPWRRYVMNLCSAQGITLEGIPAENTPIAISPGFYWLGYTPQDCLPVNTALSSISHQAEVDDRIISQTSFSFFNGTSWIGMLTQMCPGEGYMLHVASPVTLTYPDATPGKGELWLEADKVSPTGAYPQKNLQYTMPVLGKLIGYDKQVSVNEGDVIYAYVGEELRGMAYPMAAHDGFVFMSIGSDLPSGEEVHFKAWIADLGQLKLINETIRYEAFKGPGSMESPFLFTLGKVLDAPDMLTDGLFIGDPYPNPLTHQTHFPYAADSPSELTLRVYDSYGRLVYEGVHTQDSPGRDSIAFERAGLPVGVYHYQLVMQAGSRSLEKIGRMMVLE